MSNENFEAAMRKHRNDMMRTIFDEYCNYVYIIAASKIKNCGTKEDIEESIKQSKDIPFTFIKSMYKESRIIKIAKPDIIICDSHYSMPITAKFLNIPCYVITNDLTFGFSKNTRMKSIKYFEKSIRRFIIEITKSCKKIMIPDIPGVIEVPEELKNNTLRISSSIIVSN